MEHLIPHALHRQRRIAESCDLKPFGVEPVLEVLADILAIVDDEHAQFDGCADGLKRHGHDWCHHQLAARSCSRSPGWSTPGVVWCVCQVEIDVACTPRRLAVSAARNTTSKVWISGLTLACSRSPRLPRSPQWPRRRAHCRRRLNRRHAVSGRAVGPRHRTSLRAGSCPARRSSDPRTLRPHDLLMPIMRAARSSRGDARSAVDACSRRRRHATPEPVIRLVLHPQRRRSGSAALDREPATWWHAGGVRDSVPTLHCLQRDAGRRPRCLRWPRGFRITA